MKRQEAAIPASERKYGAYLRTIAQNILGDPEDVEECLNDVWFKAWTQIPSEVPDNLQAFLAKLTREAAIDLWRRSRAEKRGGGELPLCLEELSECIPGKHDVEASVLKEELALVLQGFLRTLEPLPQKVFLCRYWYFDTVPEIALHFGCSKSRVSSMLHRSRKKLKTYLKECGYFDETL